MEQECSLRRAVDLYVAEQLRALTDLATDLSLHTTLARLAQLLLRQSAGAHCNGLVDVGDLSHEELACLIGSTRVVVTRLLARLKHEGTIECNGRSMRIMNRTRLRQHADRGDMRSSDWRSLKVL